MQKKRVKHSHILPHFYLERFAYNDALHPQNKESVLIAYRSNFNKWQQKGFGQKSIFTSNGIYDFVSISESEQTVEKYLGNIETEMGKVLRKLENHVSLQSADYGFLSMFMISLLNRTTKKMNQFQVFIEQLRTIYKNFDTSVDNEYTKCFFSEYEDADKIKILKTAEIVNSSKLFEDSFYFLHNTTNIPFFTSDNPVVLKDMSKNEIENLFNFPINNCLLINRKCMILPLTPKLSVFYCEYLDKTQMNQHSISIFDENIIFKLNLLQLINCEKFVISNINNFQLDYDKCYNDLYNIDHSGDLVFKTANNKYILKAEFLRQDIFDTEIKVYDKNKYTEISSQESIMEIFAKDQSAYIQVKKLEIVKDTKKYLLVKASFIG